MGEPEVVRRRIEKMERFSDKTGNLGRVGAMKTHSSNSGTQKWHDARDRYFFFTSLAIVALLIVINVAARLIDNS